MSRFALAAWVGPAAPPGVWIGPAAALAAAGLLVGAGSLAGTGGPSAPFWRSVGIAGLAGALALLAGVALALATTLLRVRAGWLLVGLLIAPLVLPRYLAAVAWMDLIGPAGWLTTSWRPTTTVASLSAEHWLYTWPSCGLLLGACLAPLPFLAARAALLRADPGALEAARLARGAGGELRVALAVVWPQALAGALLVVALAGLEFAVPQILRVRVQAEEVYLQMSEHAPIDALRAALPLGLFVLAGALLALVLWLRRPVPAGRGVQARPAGLLGGALVWCAASIVALPGLVFPVISLTKRLLDAASLAGAPPARILREAWVFGGPDAWNSLQVGLGTACVGVALAVALGWPLRRARGGLAVAAVVALTALMSVPAPLVGAGLLVGFNRPGLAWFLDRLAVVGLACLLRFFPVAALLVWAALSRSPRDPEEAAQLAGRGPLARLLRVGLPGAAPALVAAWLILYVLAVTEYGAGALVVPPGASVLSVLVVNQAHYREDTVLAGLCVLLLAVVLAPLALWGAGHGLRRLRGRLA